MSGEATHAASPGFRTSGLPCVRTVDGIALSLREMTAADRDAVLAFARALPPHDLLFLRRDITQPVEIDALLRDHDDGQLVTILAYEDAHPVGYATVQRERDAWSSHVAELRVAVDARWRRRGLGRLLTEQAFAIALASGIEKMTARMTPDQKGAVHTFQGLGFRAEALLRDHVRDRAGARHDLLVLAHDVAAFESELGAYGVPQAVEGGRGPRRE